MLAGNNVRFLKQDASIAKSRTGFAVERGHIKTGANRVRACFYGAKDAFSDHINKQIRVMNLEDSIDRVVFGYTPDQIKDAEGVARKKIKPMYDEIESLVTKKVAFPETLEEPLFNITLAMSRMVGGKLKPDEQKAACLQLQNLFKEVSGSMGAQFEITVGPHKNQPEYLRIIISSKNPNRSLTYGWKSDGSHALIAKYDGNGIGQGDYYPNMGGNCSSMNMRNFYSGSGILFNVKRLPVAVAEKRELKPAELEK